MKNNAKITEFIQQNTSNEVFLQSAKWLQFQEAVGRKTSLIENGDFSAGIIEHILPIVGKYFYCPRGPILKGEKMEAEIEKGIQKMLDLAKTENIGWLRIDPNTKKDLEIIQENVSERIVKAPHDMQPKEVFVLDISKNAEQLLMEMKPKTRYNIGVARKKGVQISIHHPQSTAEDKYVEAFLNLTKEMARRQGITTHPEQYYRKMIEALPEEMLKIYAAEFEGKIIAVNLVLFYGETATYLHGASGNSHRNLMAPFLLQWQAILDAKEKGCTKYDFGGVKTTSGDSSWEGITNFKFGFSPKTKPFEFPGSYDIIINSRKYMVYRGLQRAKSFAVKFRR